MLKLIMAIVTAMFVSVTVQAKGIPTLKLTTDNTITLNGPVTNKSVQEVELAAKELDATLKSGYPIYLVLNTPGGSIQSGLELIEFLNSLNRPVRTVTIFAASMGWQIVQHLGNRYILNYGVLMSHKASGGFSGEFPGQLDSRLSFWKRRLYLMDKVTVARTKGKQTLKSYYGMMENELWLGGQDSVRLGYADRVIKMSCSKQLADKRQIITITTFFGSFKLKFSACPTVTGPVGVVAMIRTNQGLMTVEEFNKKGGVFRNEMIKNDQGYYNSYEYPLYALNPNVTHDKIVQEMKKQKYEFNNHKAIIKSY